MGIAVATSCLAAAAGTLLPSDVLPSAELVPGNCGFQDHMVELAGRGDTGVILPGPGVSHQIGLLCQKIQTPDCNDDHKWGKPENAQVTLTYLTELS